jgi:hypothetical protein
MVVHVGQALSPANFAGSEAEEMRLGLGGQLGGFVQIDGAPCHLHRKDVFF